MAEKYGPIFTIKLGVHQALVVNNAELARECLTKNDKAFAGRPKALAFELMAYNYAVFGFDYENGVPIPFLTWISCSIVCLTRFDYENGVPIPFLTWISCSIVCLTRIISGKRLSLDFDEQSGFQVIIRKFYELLGVFGVSDFIPYLKFLDLGGYKKMMKKTGKQLDQILEGWLKDHKLKRSELAARHEEGDDQVFINVLISKLEDACETDYPGFDHDTIIKATCLQLLAAGVDTISSTLAWALSLLLNNPCVLETARTEIDKQVGRERPVKESDMNNLVYLEAIIKESLRLHPVLPLSVPHESIQDCVVGGFNIPKGTRLIVNLSKIHRGPNTWLNPHEFQPERFLTSHQNFDVKGQRFDLIPFGAGRRMCHGDTFALHEMRLTLASLIQQFELQTPSNEPVDMSESFGITVSKQMPLEVLLAPRLTRDMYGLGP
ncbi:hypothetical protein E3N88_16321 [Mikania micrantha]|uniref:Cytochrome P450 n=1 Tax=Mikania micrantha TaxID=192012 RepID=A0A5N6NZS6_9ASTR|nr:hypothetical protein E3N88_16321 [Mikania micrantha]